MIASTVAWGEAWAAMPAWQAMACGLAFFATLYAVLCGGGWLLVRRVLPALRIGHAIDPRPPQPGQLQREIGLSALSIAIFGVGSVLPWWLLQAGWAALAPSPSWPRILAEAAVLLVWNDIHFYANHRLLHWAPLRRYHQHHHRSLPATPFSTYSFHPLEAVLLGNVILLPMLVHDFSFAALLSLPVMSLLLNVLGHSNYDFRPAAGHDHPLSASRRHHLHHLRFHGNYGFLFGFMDRWCGTRLPDEGRPAPRSAALD